MKRMHIHLSVEDLDRSVAFYSSLFGATPAKQKPDYAKWMLDDPRINFAISTRGSKPGLDHFGIEVDGPEELGALRGQMKQADLSLFDEGETACCYARSEKSWVQDSNGIAWEAYHSMADAEMFGEVKAQEPEASACCALKAPVKEELAACGTGTGCC